ncbi:MAG: DUF1311 domain-containing protein [Neisseriaceae bacterium]|nr:DUF1311 domain-containing protein [Neisseriaceae bacterium]
MKKIILSTLISISLVGVAGCSHTAHAKVSTKSQQAKKYDKMVEDCISDGSKNSSGAAEYNAIFIGCHKYGAEEIDKEIARLSQNVLKDLDDYTKKEFNAAQQSWQVYREKQCYLESMFVGSPQWGVCMLNMTQARLNELQSLYGEE